MTDLIERDAAIAAIVKEGWSKDSMPCAILRRIPAATVTGTKPSIDWSHVAQEFNWLARDKDGKAYLYQQRPRGPYAQVWHFSPFCMKTTAFASYTPGTCDWRESLIMRPGHVEGGE